MKALEWVGFDVRFNERSARLELQDAVEATGWAAERWEASDDMRGAEAPRDDCRYLPRTRERERRCRARMQFGRERWGDVMDAILNKRRVDPFKIWLNALPAWDGENRIDFWLGHVFEVGDIHEDLLSWASRSVLMGVVKRTDHPGEKHDEMVVLVGPQGIGKSTAWAWLLPGEPQRSLWFSDGLSFHDDQKAKAEALQGMVLVEASEMTGSTKAEVETIKKFLSRTNDRIRLTYRRDPSQLLRRLHDRRHDERPAVFTERRERESAVSAGARAPQATRRPPGPTWTSSVTSCGPKPVHRTRELHETAYLPDSLTGGQAELTEQYRAVDEVAEEVVGAWLAANAQGGHGKPDRQRYQLDPRQPEHLPHHDRPEAAEVHQGAVE